MKTILKNSVRAALFAFVSVAMFSCSAEDELGSLASASTRSVQSAYKTVSGVISANTTWSNDTIYQLDGKVYVSNLGGSNTVKLTIEAGTRIEGLPSTDPEEASALIITRGSQIEAIGTATNPIVFTASNSTKGGWGGLVLLGKAVNNQGTDVLIEGIDPTVITVPTDVDVYYGGTDNTDNSGTLSYVRVEYAGASIATDNELNSFTFGSVGSGTTLNHLQAYYGADDAFEWFGGNVNAKYLLAVGADDDSFDFDFGYQGKLQFLVSLIDPAVGYSSNPNGIEADNDASGSSNLPKTHPVISNITIAGTSTGTSTYNSTTYNLLYAAHLRRNTGATIVNGIFYGFPKGIVNNGGNTSGITLLTNVGTATTSTNTYVGFSSLDTTSNITVATPGNLVLPYPFGTYEGNTYATGSLSLSYKNGGLTPSSGDATGDPYDATALGSFFDEPYSIGGANDKLSAYGANWLAATWVRE